MLDSKDRKIQELESRLILMTRLVRSCEEISDLQARSIKILETELLALQNSKVLQSPIIHTHLKLQKGGQSC